MTILFYDSLLILEDEVDNVIGVVLRLGYHPSGRSNMLGTNRNHTSVLLCILNLALLPNASLNVSDVGDRGRTSPPRSRNVSCDFGLVLTEFRVQYFFMYRGPHGAIW